MNCTEVVDRFSEYLDGTASETDAAAVEGHLEACPKCARYHSVLVGGTKVLRRLPEPELRGDFEPRLRHRLYHVDDERVLRDHAASGASAVTVLAGSDAPDSFVFPGTGLHDELEHLVAAGLSPLEALRTATVEPARFLGLDGKAGTIAPGARADIVLLQGNPLSDIGAVRTVAGVVLAGSYYDRGDLDVMLEDVEAAAGSWSVWPKFVWQLLNSPIMRRQFAD